MKYLETAHYPHFYRSVCSDRLQLPWQPGGKPGIDSGGFEHSYGWIKQPGADHSPALSSSGQYRGAA